MVKNTNDRKFLGQVFRITQNIMTALVLFVAAIFFTGCTEKIELDLNDTNARLVVEASVTNKEGTHYVTLTRTANFFSNEVAPRINGAVVSISEGSNQWLMHETVSGLYVTSEEFSGEAGREYHLSIEYDGLKYHATSMMPGITGIDSLTLQPHPWARGAVQLVVHFQDPADGNDFYLWKVYVNGEDMTSPIDNMRFISDEIVNGEYLSLPVFTFSPDEYLPVSQDTIRVEMHGIVEDYYIFLDAMRRNQGAVGGPFTGPPANIPGNIDNGALGFFKVSNVSEKVLYVSQSYR